jgi:hypothetical protein
MGFRALSRHPNLAAVAGTPVGISTAAQSTLMTTLQELAPGCQLGILLGNPPRPERPSLHVFDGDAGHVLVGRFRQEFLEDLQHERRILQRLRNIPILSNSVPESVAYVQTHLGACHFRTAVAGEAAPLSITPSLRRWLMKCRFASERPASQSAFVRNLLRRTDAASAKYKELFAEATRTALTTGLETRSVPRTVIHGDFVPWNIRIDNGHANVFDWENGQLDGIPGWDEAYFHLQVGLVVSKWGPEQLLANALQLADRPPEPYTGNEYLGLVLLVIVAMAQRSDREGSSHATLLTWAIAQLIEQLHR